MALDTSLYKLIPDAITIISDAKAKLTEVAIAAIDSEGSPRQPKLQDQLIEIGVLFDQVITHLTLNVGETSVTAIVGENVEIVNILLIKLKKMTLVNLVL